MIIEEITPLQKTVELSLFNGKIKEKLYFENNVWVSKSKNIVRKFFKESKTKKSYYGYMYIDIENHSNPVFINRGSRKYKIRLVWMEWNMLYLGNALHRR